VTWLESVRVTTETWLAEANHWCLPGRASSIFDSVRAILLEWDLSDPASSSLQHVFSQSLEESRAASMAASRSALRAPMLDRAKGHILLNVCKQLVTLI